MTIPMYQHILLPLDGSTLGRSALEAVAGFGRQFESRFTLVTVLNEPRNVLPFEDTGSRGNETRLRAEEYLQAEVDALRNVGLTADFTVLESEDTATELIRLARGNQASLLAMSARGRSGATMGLFGSTTYRVIHSSPIPVLIFPGVETEMIEPWSPKPIIVPLDGSELSETALPHAMSLATSVGAPIELVRAVPATTVFGPEPYGWHSAIPMTQANEDEATRYLASASKGLAERGVQATTRVVVGNPASEIIRVVREQAGSIVVMCTRGTSGLTRWVVGSVTDAVVRASGVPVLVIPPITGQ